MGEQKIRVLSVGQPQATLLVTGLKEYETRAWDTPVRGLVLIHATKQLERDVCIVNSFYRQAFRDLGIVSPIQLPLGAIIGSVEIGATSRTDAVLGPGKEISQREQNFGDWSDGRFAWRMFNPRQCEPVPLQGKQGWWFVGKQVYDVLKWKAGLMACEFICDGCGKRAPGWASRAGQWFKPKSWFERTDDDGTQTAWYSAKISGLPTACSRECIDKIAATSGKTGVVLPF